MGTENLKKSLTYFIDLGEKIANMIDEGKINWVSLALFVIMKGGKLLFVIKHFKVTVEEWKDLDILEKDDLKKWFAEEFDISQDNVEVLVEKYFATAVDYLSGEGLKGIIEFFKNLKP